jgi:hypothetical protein
MHHVRMVERIILVRKSGGVPVFKVNAVTQSNPRAQGFSGLDILLREVDAGDSTPISLCRESAPSAESAANIEDTVGSIDMQLVEEMFGCDSSSDMKFIDRPEVFHAYAVNGLAQRLDAMVDRIQQAPVRIMIPYLAAI